MAIYLRQDDLRVGRDPSDTSWIVFRYPYDWNPPAVMLSPDGMPAPVPSLVDVAYDSGRGVAELAPIPPPAAVDPDGEWLPLDPVVAADGTAWRSIPSRDVVERRTPCAPDFAPLPGFGGTGSETGRLRRPLGLALDRRGFLYVADAGNHRVQVVRTDGGEVVFVLGRVDGWGAPIAGTSGGAMTEPVDVACDASTGLIFVADRAGGRVHVFDAAFRFVRSFAPEPQIPRPAGPSPRPLAVVVLPDGTLLVADAVWPRLLHVDAHGVPLGEVALQGSSDPRLAGLRARLRFAPEGEIVIGPLDGRSYDTAWHEVLLDAELPAGTSVEAQTFAGEDPTAFADRFPWAPPEPIAAPDDEADSQVDAHDDDGTRTEYRRLVLSDMERWRRETHGAYDRGRPVVARFDGDGPTAGALLVMLPFAARRLVRAGDGLVLAVGPAGEPAEVAGVDPAVVTVAARGDLALPFGAGTEVRLAARDGRPLSMMGSARLVYILAGAESIGLSAAPDGDTAFDVPLPHGAAAWLRPGDRIALAAGARNATVEILAIADGPAAVRFVAPLAGDFSTGVLSLDRAAGRLVAKDLDGWERSAPSQEPIRVFDDTIGASVAATVALADSETMTLLLDAPLAAPVTSAGWTRFETSPGAATDRGRYLWVRLRLIGARLHPADTVAVATPAVRGLRLTRQRPSYLRHLPATYGRRDDAADPSGALFLERFLTLFESQLTGVEIRYEDFSRLLDVEALEAPEWLAWLGSWLGLVLDPAWTAEQKRTLILNAVDLYRRRGTSGGISRAIEITTGRSPEIVEAFRERPSHTAILGHKLVLGCTPLADPARPDPGCDPRLLDGYAHRFTVYAYADDACAATATEATTRVVIDASKPGHTTYDLRVVTPDARVGLQSTVGLDLVLGGGRPRDTPVALRSPGPSIDPGFKLT